MTRMSARGLVLVVGAVAFCTACSRQGPSPAAGPGTPPASAPAASLRPIAIPDFTSLAPAVRAQMESGADEYRTTLSRGGAAASERAEAYGTFGKLLLSAGYRATAEACFLNAEALEPKDMRWPYYLGHAYKRDGKVAESTAAFERAVRADGSFMPALVWLGNAYLDQAEPDKAQPLFEKALALKPDTAAAIFGLGRAALARRDYATAVQRFERTLALAPSAAMVHQPLALAYRGLGQADRAAAHFAAADGSGGELRPPDPLDVAVPLETAVGYDVRGTRALEAGEWKTAADLLANAVRLAPDDPAVRHKYATALAMNGEYGRAQRELEAVTRRRPDFAKAHYSLGLIRAQDGDVRGAIESFRSAVSAAPTYLEARLQLADALRRSGNASAALPEYVRILEVDPRVVDARFGRAMALVMLKRYGDARDELAEGMMLHPDEAGFALALSRVLAAAPADGVRDGPRALSVLDGIPAAKRRVEWGVVRAMALAESGRFDDAARLQRAVIAALEKNGSPDLARTQEAVLRQYEQRRPSRMPWGGDEPMELPG